jgi:cellulose synthase/poly-beta-1,6-N-acetylglucosamine synthase-like glycosyltransferase
MIALFAWLCVLPPTLALLYLSLEVTLGLRTLATTCVKLPPADVTVVVPAHNEALSISDTVRSVLCVSHSATRVLVIADNCSDGTAELARTEGATVIERNDDTRRGKGYALAFARDYLASAPPAAVFILDADCRIERGSAELLASIAVARGEPVQARNLLSAPADAPPLVLLSNFAFLLKNLVRARGMYRLGGGITLSGTGMAFPWKTFAQAELATSDAVEDLRLALALASKGTKVHLCEDVQVTSAAAEPRDSMDQRRRWEHGFLTNASRHGLPLLLEGAARRSRHLAVLGAHMLVPPLALLFLVAFAALLPAGVLVAWNGNSVPAMLLLGALVCGIVTTALAWHREGRLTLSARTLIRAPLYILWKLPLYLGFFSARQTEWNRTRRLNEKS